MTSRSILSSILQGKPRSGETGSGAQPYQPYTENGTQYPGLVYSEVNTILTIDASGICGFRIEKRGATAFDPKSHGVRARKNGSVNRPEGEAPTSAPALTRTIRKPSMIKAESVHSAPPLSTSAITQRVPKTGSTPATLHRGKSSRPRKRVRPAGADCDNTSPLKSNGCTIIRQQPRSG
jgi:hypothetical protein